MTNKKPILITGLFCFLMLVSIPLISATEYIYPPEDGPYRVSVVGTCDSPWPPILAMPDVGIKIGPLCWFTVKDDGPQFTFWNQTIFKIKGKQQNYTLTAQSDFWFWGFKGYAAVGTIKLLYKMFLHGFFKVPIYTRIYGVCTAIYVATY